MITNNKSHSSIDYLPPREFKVKFLYGKLLREAYDRELERKINEK
ncbi:MAG: hypothetical protein QXP36_03025 [Conexivisphaerales archaeon]